MKTVQINAGYGIACAAMSTTSGGRCRGDNSNGQLGVASYWSPPSISLNFLYEDLNFSLLSS